MSVVFSFQTFPWGSLFLSLFVCICSTLEFETNEQQKSIKYNNLLKQWRDLSTSNTVAWCRMMSSMCNLFANRYPLESCAPKVPGCHGWLTFDCGPLEKLTLFIYPLLKVLGKQDFMVGKLWAPHLTLLMSLSANLLRFVAVRD